MCGLHECGLRNSDVTDTAKNMAELIRAKDKWTVESETPRKLSEVFVRAKRDFIKVEHSSFLSP